MHGKNPCLIVIALCFLNAHLEICQARVSDKERSKKKLCFTVIGDIGGVPHYPFSTWNQRKVADEMAKIMSKKDCRFIVALGDNFYNSGVKDVHDKRFSQTFEKVYTKKFHYVPWYFVAGNHDHYSNVSAQIAYSKVSPRWQFPHYFHSKVHNIPGTDKSVHAIFIDTTLLSHICEKNRQNNEPLVHGQLKWITNELKKSKSDYLIVAGHHPILSAGAHGNSPCLMTKLKPLLEKYDVTAYFSGHDHNLQHINDPKSNVAYFVSGSGNFYNGWHSNARKLPKGSLRHFYSNNGFAIVCLNNKRMKVMFFNGKNHKFLYKTSLSRRKRKE